MERNREGRRTGTLTAGGGISSATRRPRVKDVSDDEDRMEGITESCTWERTKKEVVSSFHVSIPRQKRKRPGFPHDSGEMGGSAEDVDDSSEEIGPAASEEEDEPPPPPVHKKLGRSRGHVKEDEFIMDIPSVPRKARSSMSSSSRFSSISRRQHESSGATDIIRHKSPVTPQIPPNGSSSVTSLSKSSKRLKPSNTKSQPLPVKVPKVSDLSSISDQEAEVAEALFVLARGLPSRAGIFESKAEAKVVKEARSTLPSASLPSSSVAQRISGSTSASPLAPGSSGNDNSISQVKDSTGLNAEAPKRKRPRPAARQDDGKNPMPVHVASTTAFPPSWSPSIPETEISLEKTTLQTDALHQSSQSPQDKGVSDSSPSALAHLCNEDTAVNEAQGEKDMEQVETEEVKASKCQVELEEKKCMQSELETEDKSINNSEVPTCRFSRSADSDVTKLDIDLMVPAIKVVPSAEEGSIIPSGIPADTKTARMTPPEVANMETTDIKAEELAKESVTVDGVVKFQGLDKEKQNGMASGVNQNSDHEVKIKKEQTNSEVIKEEEREKGSEPTKVTSQPQQKEELDNTTATSVVSSVPSTTASSNGSPMPLAGWMGGLPHLSYYGSGVSPWGVGSSLPSPSFDVKASHPTVQLPHSAILPPVRRMKRCATHVYLARFIYRDQQLSRHSQWSAALCRATPYNLNIPAVNLVENENSRNVPAQQSLPPYGYTMSQSGGSIVPTSTALGTGATTTSNHSTPSASIETGTAPPGNVINAQYLQAMMQQSGFPSFPFTFNGPGQAAQFFNGPFFPPQMMTTLPHIQQLGLQSGSIQKQQGVGSMGHSLPPQLVTPSLQQQQLHLQLAPQSPTPSQQPPNAPHFGEKESNIPYSEGVPIIDQRSMNIQKNVSGPGPSNLPNLNVSPSTLIMGGGLPVISSNDQEISLMNLQGTKQGGKTIQTPFQGQNSPSLSSSVQQKQLISQSAAPAPLLQMKIHDQSLPQGYSAVSRGPVCSGPLGLQSMNPVMATQGHGVLTGSTENSRFHMQHQGYGGNNQQYQRTMAKSVSGSEDSYTAKGRDFTVKQPGTPLLSRVDMEASSPSLQGSPSSGGVSAARGQNNIIRNPNSATSPVSQSSRTTVTVGAAQSPLSQNQPSKQTVQRSKTGPGSNLPSTATINALPPYVDRALPGNVSKFPGTVLPFSGQTLNSTQGSKQVNSTTGKMNQRMPGGQASPQVAGSAVPKGQLNQTRNNQPVVPSTPPRVMTTVTGPMLSSSSISMSAPPSPSVPKANQASKNPSNGKGNPSNTKPTPPSKKPPSSGSSVSSMNSGQLISTKAPGQQKSQPMLNVSQFSHQLQAQQQTVGTKGHSYPHVQQQQGQYKQSFQQQSSSQRPQTFLNQQKSQYLQQPLSQQQHSVSQHVTQSSLPNHYQQNPQNSQTMLNQQQMSHLQQQSQNSPSPTTSASNNGLSLNSSNLIHGSSISGSVTSAVGDQFRGSVSRAPYGSGNLLSTGLPDMMSMPALGQLNSPHTGSSNCSPMTCTKPSDHKVSFDSSNCEELNTVRHLPSTSPSQAALVPNSAST